MFAISRVASRKHCISNKLRTLSSSSINHMWMEKQNHESMTERSAFKCRERKIVSQSWERSKRTDETGHWSLDWSLQQCREMRKSSKEHFTFLFVSTLDAHDAIGFKPQLVRLLPPEQSLVTSSWLNQDSCSTFEQSTQRTLNFNFYFESSVSRAFTYELCVPS